MFLSIMFFLSISSHRETNFSLIFCHLRHGCTCGSGEMVKDWANMTSHYRLIIFGFILCSFPLRPVNVCVGSEGDHERETFKDRKKKTERGILGNSKRESACLEQLPKTRALGEGGSCKLGAEQELGSPPHSCILGQPDSTSLYSSSTAKDFHLQLWLFLQPNKKQFCLFWEYGAWKTRRALENVLGSECNWWVPSSIVVQQTGKMYQGILTLPQGRRLLNA